MTLASEVDRQTAKRLFDQYTPDAGAYDEYMSSPGKPREHWTSLISQVEKLGERELHRRWEQAQNQIARDGITFDPHDADNSATRPWILDAVPLLLREAEWKDLTAKLAQRAQLLELILNDLFGEQRLLKEKIVPPDVLYGHPAYRPAYHDLQKSGQRYLLYHAADISRNARGEWWVTADRTRSPFGLGYVLENRIATSQMLSSIFRESKVQRLAGFFVTLKEELRKLAPQFKDNPRIAIWTKGAQSRGYFEDSYLARYLGYVLAEGGDLAVRDNRVMLKTLGGLLPVEVLLRRIDDDDCDPVELRSDSPIGVSGLLEVLRAGRVAIGNSLGSRLVESPIFLAFLPKISQFLLGEPLELPTVATWWCGDSKACDYVLTNIDRLLVRPAFRMGDEAPVHPALMKPQERQELIARIKSNPHGFVGQEVIERSTAPVVVNDRAVPWYLTLRTFQVSTDNGYQALPGGLARVSPDSHELDFTMTAGERSQDVWILAEEDVPQVSLLAPVGQLVTPRRSGSELPSRVADNLFWLGRYVERAEQMARLLRTVTETLADEAANESKSLPLIRVLVEQGQLSPESLIANPVQQMRHLAEVLPSALFDTSRPQTLRSSIENAVRVAAKVRDRIAIDMWRTIDRVEGLTRPPGAAHVFRTVDMMETLEKILSELVCFAGLSAESMTRTLGWRFLDLGYRIERCWKTSSLLRLFFCTEVPVDTPGLETILRVSNSLMTYRNRYLSTFQIPALLDLLITDETNPRSIAYQLARVDEHLAEMPHDEHLAVLNPEQRLALSMTHAVKLADVFELSETNDTGGRDQLDKLLKRLSEQIPKLSDALSARFLIHAGLPRHFASSSESRRPKDGLPTEDKP